VPQISVGMVRLVTATIVLALLSANGSALAATEAPIIRTVDIGHGITLHYVEQGTGTPVIFVHGSLSDGGYWADQIGPFAGHYRAIAYSRRYNYPNVNPARPGYSAVVDAEDLAGFIHTLHLGKVVVIGHSYGALTALFLAAKHPELVRALVLAEPPAISLLAHLPGDETKTGKAMSEDIRRRMVVPMQQAFRRGDRDAGIAAFIDYVFNDPHAWDKMSDSARAAMLRDAHEWDVMMKTGTLFPNIEPSTLRRITAPVLLISGAKSYPFLGLITEELARLLPNRETIVLPDAGHQMWYQAPDVCRRDVEAFLVRMGIQSRLHQFLTLAKNRDYTIDNSTRVRESVVCVFPPAPRVRRSQARRRGSQRGDLVHYSDPDFSQSAYPPQSAETGHCLPSHLRRSRLA
jgi:non-heme chloroperoxidase